MIAATNAELESKIEAHEFRKDLFYRLNVFTINLPPLRERANDVILLARYFLERLEIRTGEAKALTEAREKSELLRSRSKARDANGKPLPFDGVLSIQADKRVQYDTVRKILYTAGAAGYRVFRFIALQRDS